MRHITQTKRGSGLVKKAMELSILCGCEVSLIIINEQGIASTFASSGSLQGTLDRVNSLPSTNVSNILLHEVIKLLSSPFSSLNNKFEILFSSMIVDLLMNLLDHLVKIMEMMRIKFGFVLDECESVVVNMIKMMMMRIHTFILMTSLQ